jgi:hypothetical protein
MEQNQGMTRTLDFTQNRVELLTLDELRATVDELDITSKRINGIAHHVLISRVLQMVEENGLHGTLEPIYATDNKGKVQGVNKYPMIEKTYGENSLQSYILRRILTRVVIGDMEDNVSNTAIAISYHQDGIELAIGPNIKICQNMSILGKGHHIRSYGTDKMPDIEKMLEVTSDWLTHYQEKRERDQKILEVMNNTILTSKQVSELIGNLTLRRVGKDELAIKKDAPLNQSNISRFTKEYLIRLKSVRDSDNEVKDLSLYDIYNIGTGLMKPDSHDFSTLLYNNASFGDYIIKTYVDPTILNQIN